ncbi:MAG: hypothetical protein GKC53_04765 [Neisseriaceae bacterium]|nr:MAG: hypothetical protein GKC53_04765 [Neisseriaceae bacterium]
MRKLSLVAFLALFSTAAFAEDKAPKAKETRSLIPAEVVQTSADLTVVVGFANGLCELIMNIVKLPKTVLSLGVL